MIILHSSRSISDCRTRLAHASILSTTLGPVSGSTNGDRFHLYRVRRDFRNSFAPHFYGELVSEADGTRIQGKFRMHSFILAFLGIWFGLLALMCGKLLTERSTANIYFGFSFAMALFLCALAIVYLGKRLGTDDETEITAFLKRVLDAKTLIPELPSAAAKAADILGATSPRKAMKLPLANGRYRKPAELLAKLVGFSGLAIWLFSFYVFYQYDDTRPRQPEVSFGRIYPQNNHGHIVYLTGEEDRRVTNLRVLAFVLFGVSFTIGVIYIENPFRKKAPWETKQW